MTADVPSTRGPVRPECPRAGRYLLTWTTHGTWLPGDPRGFVGRVPDAELGHAIHNIVNSPRDESMPSLTAEAKRRLRGEPVRLSRRHADVCHRAFLEVRDHHEVSLYIGAIMVTHVHLVVGSSNADGARLLNLFKGVSSRRLGQAFEPPAGSTWWTRHGSRRLLTSPSSFERAIEYVREQPSPLIVFGGPQPP